MTKILFYNHHANGDLHVSRTFIKTIIDNCKQKDPNLEFIYSHKNDPVLLCDIPELKHDSEIYKKIDPHCGDFIFDDVFYINTWYHCKNNIFGQYFDNSFDCLFYLFNEIAEFRLGFSFKQYVPEILFPNIDFDFVEGIDHINSELEKYKGKKKVLIANGPAMSGQCANFPLLEPATKVIGTNDTIIIYTNEEEGLKLDERFIKSDTLFPALKTKSNLMQHAYLSTFCDVIIGRASGVSTFAFNTENLFKRSPIIFNFSRLPKPNWLSKQFENTIKYNAKVERYEGSDPTKILEHLERLIIK